MNNVVYIKHFENGNKYIGITSNFDKRMREHEMAKDNLLVHCAMRKHSHYTEIVFRSSSYEDVLAMERVVIQNFIDIGYNLGDGLYNMTLGGEGTLGCINHADVSGSRNPMYGKTHAENARRKISSFRKSYTMTEDTKRKLSNSMKGKNNPMYGKTHSDEVKNRLSFMKRKENLSAETLTKMRSSAKRGADNYHYREIAYYEETPIARGDFKKACKRKGLDFNHFKEVYCGEKDNGGHKLFLYKYMGEEFIKQIDYEHELHKPKEYYETNSMVRANFKNVCKSRGWNINDFEQVRAEQCITTSGRKYYKYYYFYIDKL